MRRRILPITAVALAGLLVGAWLSWAPPAPAPAGPPARPAPRQVAARAAASPLVAPDADTGPPALPPPAADQRQPAREVASPALADMVPMGRVRCELDNDRFDDLVIVAHAGADLLAQGLVDGFSRDELDAGLRQPLRWRARGATLDIDAPVDTMLLSFEIQDGDRTSNSTVSIRWRDDQGVCQSTIPTTPPRRIHLAGRVAGVVEGDQVWLTGCALDRHLGDDDRFDSTVTIPDHICELFATRVDGLIAVRGPSVDIDPADGDRTDILLHLPDYDVGGIGAPVQVDPDGLRLGEPREGSPAQFAGLAAGDVVLQADGEALAGLSMYDMIDRVTGEVGTTVQILVRSPDGSERVVEVQREWIEE